MRIKKLLAKLFIVIAAFFVVLSPVVSIAEAHHHCDHEECQICEVIRTTKETIKQTDTPSPAPTISFALPIIFLFVAAITYIAKDIDFTTLVSLKKKLSN